MLKWPDDLKRFFKFRNYSSEDALPLNVERAKQLISADIGKEYTCNPSDGLVNDELLYLPYQHVGCFGVLVERKSGSIWWLGSAVPPLDQVWGYYIGARNGQTHDDRLCDLIIEKVNDLDGTIALLRDILDRSYVEELIPKLNSPPITLTSIDVYWILRDLRVATSKKLFSFRVLS
jgi:hypothetical protein